MQHHGLTEGGAVEEAPSSTGFVLVIEGSALDFALQEELRSHFLELSGRCRAVICCRSTPLQKSQTVQLVRDQLGVMTLAVGRRTPIVGDADADARITYSSPITLTLTITLLMPVSGFVINNSLRYCSASGITVDTSTGYGY